jgi:hypothetical protein
MIEHITSSGRPVCYIVRAELNPKETTFLTPPTFNLQVGFVVYGAGGEIPRHAHKPIERRITGTAEVLVVKKGRCQIDIYDDEREMIATRDLYEGDIMLMVSGGHGFRMLEETVLLEIKQGPYPGAEEEKERF